MQSKTLIALTLSQNIPLDYTGYIGVDKGAYVLANKHISMELAIGDFDSVDGKQLDLIRQYAKKVMMLPKEKDVTDMEAVLPYLDPKQSYEIIGGLHGRIDHELCNLRLIYQNPHLCLKDEQNVICCYTQGQYVISKQHTYLSLFTFDMATISLQGVKYPLEDRILTALDTYTVSNEIIGDTCQLIIHQGKVLVMQSAD